MSFPRNAAASETVVRLSFRSVIIRLELGMQYLEIALADLTQDHQDLTSLTIQPVAGYSWTRRMVIDDDTLAGA